MTCGCVSPTCLDPACVSRVAAVRARLFPIQNSPSRSPVPPSPVRGISWALAERAYGDYRRRYGQDQSLEKIAERGGFHPGEMDQHVPGWREELSELLQLRAQLELAQKEVIDLKKQLEERPALDNQESTEV